MKILVVAQNFHTGGIQRALINMLEELIKYNGLSIDLLVFGDGPLLNEVPTGINIIQSNELLRLTATPFFMVRKNEKTKQIIVRVILILLVRIFKSKNFYNYLFSKVERLKTYDVAISYFNDAPKNYFNRGTNQFVEKFVVAKKKIAWIHTDPLIAGFDKEECKEKYLNFDLIIGVSDAVSEKFKEFLPEYKERVKTVYNFFPIEKIKSLSRDEIIKPTQIIPLITVSRIDNSSKRLDIIPGIVVRLTKNNITNFCWTVVGEGPNLEELKSEVRKLGIEKHLRFIGNKKNPYPLIKNSSLFVLVSKFEGYPMVIGESLILETPVITTNFAAASEQISHNENGIITSMDEDAIYSTLSEILTRSATISEMKKRITETPFTNTKAQAQLKKILEISND